VVCSDWISLSAFSAFLLPDPDHGVDDEDEEDDERLHEGRRARLPALRAVVEREHEGDHGRGQQDADQRVVELLQNCPHAARNRIGM
jgi:hypothetical protein